MVVVMMQETKTTEETMRDQELKNVMKNVSGIFQIKEAKRVELRFRGVAGKRGHTERLRKVDAIRLLLSGKTRGWVESCGVLMFTLREE